MKIEVLSNLILSDTTVPDIFISEYLPGIEPLSIKIYLYCLFLNKKNDEVSIEGLSIALGIEQSLLYEKILTMQTDGIVCLQKNTITIQDLKMKEIDKLYRPRMASKIEENDSNINISKEQNQSIKSISDKFFSGQMSSSWYTEIDFWFEKHGFDPEVMFMLFQHCCSNNVMTKPYVRKVAENWANKNIRTAEQLEKYLKDYENYKSVKTQVCKKLRINRSMYEYEEILIEKWFFTYGYCFEIIEIALKKSVNRSNPTLATFDYIISEWYKNGLKSISDIQKYEDEKSKKYAPAAKKFETGDSNITQKKNYKERNYDNTFFDSFYTDARKENK